MKKKIRILHVDDSLHDRQLVLDALKNSEEEYDVIEAVSREQFEEVIRNDDFDLVLSDFNILGFDGLQVLQVIKEKYPDVPVIIVTGTGSEEVAIQAMKMGASDYVIKTVHHIKGLPAIIQRVLKSNEIIQDHNRALIALRENEELFRTAFESAAIGVALVGLDGNYINANETFCKMIGYSLEELVHHSFNDFTHPEDLDSGNMVLSQMVAGGKSIGVFEKRYIHKNGEVIWVNISSGFVKKASQNRQYIVTYVQNITNRKRTEAELLRLNESLEHRVRQRTSELQLANSELEAFSYSVSHDLRAPLRAIHGYTNILLEDHRQLLDDEGKRLCDEIMSNASRMGRLIDDLLAFSRIGKNVSVRLEIDMEELARTVTNELISPLDATRITVGLAKLPPAFGDMAMIKQVWINLISNALKYSSKKEHAEIEIGFQKDRTETIYFVKDNGVGFDMQDAGRLFRPFHRLHSTRDYEGSGIGLAIVNRIIRRQGGRVWAEAEAGKGASLFFTMPVDHEDT